MLSCKLCTQKILYAMLKNEGFVSCIVFVHSTVLAKCARVMNNKLLGSVNSCSQNRCCAVKLCISFGEIVQLACILLSIIKINNACVEKESILLFKTFNILIPNG